VPFVRPTPPVAAVESLDIAVREGEIFGFLGPNGAGKSTTIGLQLGLLQPTAGAGRVLGLDIVRDRVAIGRRVGYLPLGSALYDSLTGERLLDYLAELRAGAPSAPRVNLKAKDIPRGAAAPFDAALVATAIVAAAAWALLVFPRRDIAAPG
jgi:ABC-type multidrug transport system ATPase subunit